MNRVLQLAGLFDLDADDLDGRSPAAQSPLTIPARGIVLITGPSGAGKSTLLRATVEVARHSSCVIDDGALPPLDPQAAVIESFPGELPRVLSTLSRAGLAEARLLARPIATLSVGQRARLMLAHSIHRAMQSADEHPDRPILIIIDEFLAALDRLTARVIARGLRRWLDRTSASITCVLATAHDDLAAALQPELHARFDLAGRLNCTTRDKVHPPPQPAEERAALGGEIIIERGGMREYDAIAAHHYRAGRPATVAQIHRAVYLPDRADQPSIVAGILIVSYPALSAEARRRALGARYEELPTGIRGRSINRELRTISRVIIEPRFRGLGLASRMVRHALHEAETPCTEAFASMGRLHPFFARAGMQRFDPVPTLAAARFNAVLRAVGIRPELIAASARFQHAIEALPAPLRQTIEREMIRLAPGSDSTTIRARCRAAVFGGPVYFLNVRDEMNE